MYNRVEIQFESIALQDQRVRGQPDDYLLAVVHFDFQHPDGRVETGCVASIRHRFREPSVDAVEVSVPAAYQCPAYRQTLERAIEAYYRRRVGSAGSAIRIGPKGASPILLGALLESRASEVFVLDVPEPAASDATDILDDDRVPSIEQSREPLGS